MQLVRTEMRVPSCHRQTLVPQQISDILKWSALHSQPACERMTQVVPAKILDARFTHGVVQPMPSIFKRRPSFGRLEHTTSPVALIVRNPEGGHRSIIQRDVYSLFVLRPRNIQQPASPVYHVPRQAILAARTQTDINR